MADAKTKNMFKNVKNIEGLYAMSIMECIKANGGGPGWGGCKYELGMCRRPDYYHILGHSYVEPNHTFMSIFYGAMRSAYSINHPFYVNGSPTPIEQNLHVFPQPLMNVESNKTTLESGKPILKAYNMLTKQAAFFYAPQSNGKNAKIATKHWDREGWLKNTRASDGTEWGGTEIRYYPKFGADRAKAEKKITKALIRYEEYTHYCEEWAPKAHSKMGFPEYIFEQIKKIEKAIFKDEGLNMRKLSGFPERETGHIFTMRIKGDYYGKNLGIPAIKRKFYMHSEGNGGVVQPYTIDKPNGRNILEGPDGKKPRKITYFPKISARQASEVLELINQYKYRSMRHIVDHPMQFDISGINQHGESLQGQTHGTANTQQGFNLQNILNALSGSLQNTAFPQNPLSIRNSAPLYITERNAHWLDCYDPINVARNLILPEDFTTQDSSVTQERQQEEREVVVMCIMSSSLH